MFFLVTRYFADTFRLMSQKWNHLYICLSLRVCFPKYIWQCVPYKTETDTLSHEHYFLVHCVFKVLVQGIITLFQFMPSNMVKMKNIDLDNLDHIFRILGRKDSGMIAENFEWSCWKQCKRIWELVWRFCADLRMTVEDRLLKKWSSHLVTYKTGLQKCR